MLYKPELTASVFTCQTQGSDLVHLNSILSPCSHWHHSGLSYLDVVRCCGIILLQLEKASITTSVCGQYPIASVYGWLGHMKITAGHWFSQYEHCNLKSWFLTWTKFIITFVKESSSELCYLSSGTIYVLLHVVTQIIAFIKRGKSKGNSNQLINMDLIIFVMSMVMMMRRRMRRMRMRMRMRMRRMSLHIWSLFGMSPSGVTYDPALHVHFNPYGGTLES